MFWTTAQRRWWVLGQFVLHWRALSDSSNAAVQATLLQQWIVNSHRAVFCFATFGFWLAMAPLAAGLRIPSNGGVKHVVIGIPDTNRLRNLFGIVNVAFAQTSSASAWIVGADNLFPHFFPRIFFSFSNAFIPKFHSNTFLAGFVFFACDVQLVDWLSLSHLAHWPVAEDEAVASVRPILSLVESFLIMTHNRQQIGIPSGRQFRVCRSKWVSVLAKTESEQNKTYRLHFFSLTSPPKTISMYLK